MLLPLCRRSFQSGWQAYKLLLSGAYTQSIMVSRHLAEDYPVAIGAISNLKMRTALETGSAAPTFADLAKGVSEAHGHWWSTVYGPVLSEIAHPRRRSLKVQASDDGTMPVGTFYSREQAMASIASLLEALSLMMAMTATLSDLHTERKSEGRYFAIAERLYDRVSKWFTERGEELNLAELAPGGSSQLEMG